jgi:hypothetical protein
LALWPPWKLLVSVRVGMLIPFHPVRCLKKCHGCWPKQIPYFLQIHDMKIHKNKWRDPTAWPKNCRSWHFLLLYIKGRWALSTWLWKCCSAWTMMMVMIIIILDDVFHHYKTVMCIVIARTLCLSLPFLSLHIIASNYCCYCLSWWCSVLRTAKERIWK